MTHNLLLNYKLYQKMEVFVSMIVLCGLGLPSARVSSLSDTHTPTYTYTHAPMYSPLPQRPHAADDADMTKYHSDEYVKFLKTISPENVADHSREMTRCTWFT